MKMMTVKNTKQEILEAYNEAITKLNENKTQTIVQEQEEKRIERVKADAKEMVNMNILNPEIVERYKNLDEAITLAQKELDDLFEIKAQALSFEALMVAKNKKLAELDDEIKYKEQAIKDRVTEANVQYEDAVKRMNNDLADKKKTLDKERVREEEEYAYNLKRERQKENDAWEDEKAEREGAVKAREEAVAKREQDVTSQEAYIKALEQQVDEMPEVVEEAVAKAMAEAKSKSDKTYSIEKAHLIKEHEWATKNLTCQIEDLKRQLEEVQAAKRLADEKLDKAYAEMKTLATTTVQSSGVKVIETAQRV